LFIGLYLQKCTLKKQGYRIVKAPSSEKECLKRPGAAESNPVRRSQLAGANMGSDAKFQKSQLEIQYIEF